MPSAIEPICAALFERYGKRRAGIHLSDLICPRETVFRLLHPQQLTRRDLYFFAKGRAMGDAIQTLAEDDPETWIAECEGWLKPNGAVAFVVPEVAELGRRKSTWDLYMQKIKAAGIDPDSDLQCHIDIYNKKQRFPVELKTYDGSKIEQPKPHQLWQLKAYMVYCYSEDGNISYMYRNYDDPMKEFPIFMTEEQRKEIMKTLIEERRLIKLAKETKNPALAPDAWEDPDRLWKCQYCKFVEPCQDIRRAQGKTLIRPESLKKRSPKK